MHQMTNEEMEVLNTAAEILSKYANRGKLTAADLDCFERMIVSIIDGNNDFEEESDIDKPIIPKMVYPTTQIRVDNRLFCRDRAAEVAVGIDDMKFYGYYPDSGSLNIFVEIKAKRIIKSFCLSCTLYDKDGDIIETKENDSYGSGVVTNVIKPGVFFDGFPAKFMFYQFPAKRIRKISIFPTD